MKTPDLGLKVLPGRLAVARLGAHEEFPEWALTGTFLSVTRTADELSIVCEEGAVPETARAERGFRAFRVDGTLDFTLTGILARIADPLATASISIFAISTFDTDYVLVREQYVNAAIAALRLAGLIVADWADAAGEP